MVAMVSPEPEYAERIFTADPRLRRIRLPESHAASLRCWYATAWLRAHPRGVHVRLIDQRAAMGFTAVSTVRRTRFATASIVRPIDVARTATGTARWRPAVMGARPDNPTWPPADGGQLTPLLLSESALASVPSRIQDLTEWSDPVGLQSGLRLHQELSPLVRLACARRHLSPRAAAAIMAARAECPSAAPKTSRLQCCPRRWLSSGPQPPPTR